MMSSKVLRKSERNGRVMRLFKRIVDWLIHGYHQSLRSFMKHRWLALPVMLITAGLIGVFGSVLQRELAPMEDKSRIRLSATAPEGTSYDAMDAYQVQLMQLMDTLKEKQFLMGITGGSGGSSSSSNTSMVRITLSPPNERTRSQMEIAQDLNRIVRKYNFAQTLVVQEPTISAARGGRNSLPVQFVIQAPDLERLKRLSEVYGESPVRSHVRGCDHRPALQQAEYAVDINRNKALAMGVSVGDIARTIQTYLSEQRLGILSKTASSIT
jgi:multidrug efflux pump subunit AcrB